MKYEYFSDPIPHLYFSELVPNDVYEKIKFPELEPTKNRRATRGLFKGEKNYSDIISSDGWKDVYQSFTDLKFVIEIINIFSKDISKHNCNLQLDKIHLIDYVESYKEVLSTQIDKESDPNALFLRFDFQAADKTYDKKVHCDHARRLFGGVLFFSDYREEKIEGGKFALYRDEEFKEDRFCHKPKIVKEFPVIHNTGVLFLNSNEGFHGATEITSIEGWRKWIYYSVSSKRNIWQSKPASTFSRAFKKIKTLKR